MEETLLPSPLPPPQPHVASHTSESIDENGSFPAPGLPPPASSAILTPSKATAAGIGAGTDSAAGESGDRSETRPSRSASTASRTNRLSLTLPIAPPTAPSSRPLPTSSSSSFPATPNDLALSAASPVDPADIITAIAAQERRVLELREELSREESNLNRLKRQWANHEVLKKRTESRRAEQMRSLSVKTGTAVSASSLETPLEDIGSKRTLEEDRRKALLLGQQPSADPSTPTQSRRRVFRGSHARTLSLLSPTKTSSAEEPFSVHEDHVDDSELLKSPKSTTSAASHEPGSPFYQGLQQLSRYTPITAAQLSKRASWAPQSVNQVAGLKQVADDFTATLRTFVDDLRQATVGDEPITGSASAMRTVDTNSRPTHNDDPQSTIRASASAPGRPHASRAFTMEPPGTPTPQSRHSATAVSASTSGVASHTKEKTAKSSSEATASKRVDAKASKHFSWSPLTADAFDDSDWSSWDTPTVKSRWSGSTVNGDDPAAASIPEQVDENVAPQKAEPLGSPSSPDANKTADIDWPAALKGLTPSNIKRTATNLMKEWEKSLALPADSAGAPEEVAHIGGV